VIDSVGPFSVKTDRLLTFAIVTHDSTDADTTHRVFLTADNLPENAVFTDNNDNTGTFEFTPVPGQEGVDTITFYATDNGSPQLTASLDVEVTIVGVNVPPVLSEIGPQTVTEGEILEVVITATDPEGTIPAILADGMPNNSSIVDSGNGTAVFTFTPNYVQSGLHSVTLKAYDGIDIDKEVVLIQVYEAGNQVPEFTLIPSPQVVEGEILEDVIMAADPDSTPVEIFIDTSFYTIESFELVDSGNGVASFTVAPTYVQAGLWDVWLVVSDGELTDTAVMTIDVVDAGNQLPVLNEITDKSILEGETLEFTITASDPDLTTPVLSAGNLPGDALFYDYQIGEGVFNWTPDATEHGDYEVMFYAIDADSAELVDSQAVTITVIDSNYTPNVYPDPIYQPSYVDEGDTMFYVVKGTDPDGDFPILGARMSTGEIGDPLESNMSFYDSANGHGVLTFVPDYTQGNNNPTKYYLVFYVIDAMDGTKMNEYTGVTLNVYQKNAVPTISFEAGTGPFSITEGSSLAFNVLAEDADGTPTITVENLPTNASVNGDADSVYFEFNPDYTQSGQYTVRFIVTDDVMAADSQEIEINVTDAGNQKVVFTSGPGEQVDAAVNIPREIEVVAFDPEGETITLNATPVVNGATFTNNGDGTGLYSFTPTSTQLDSVYVVTFIAQDPSMTADTLETNLRVVVLMRGDADANHQYTMNDIVYLISYIFRGGSEPTLLEAADVDDSGEVNVSDVAYLVNYLYNSGPKPPQ